MGSLVAAIAVALRYVLNPLIGEVAPFVFVFAGVAIAAILGGWRSGFVAMVVGQVLTLYLIIGPLGSFYTNNTALVTAMVVATISQAILLLTIGLYQREVDRGVAEREKRLDLLDEALREIDHRTRNNYQTVIAVIELQARRTTNEAVGAALRQVGERIRAIAKASEQLAVRSADLGAVRLDDHLCGLVEQIGRGLSREEIAVDCEVDDVTVTADQATSISIIVNELVTNAIKHAFNGEASGRVRVTGRFGSGFELVVADDGRGIANGGPSRTGLGTRLVESFARQLGAKHEVVSSASGTTHRLLIPTLN